MKKSIFCKGLRLSSFMVMLLFSVAVFAEEAAEKITVSFSKILLSEAINQVEQVSGYTFFYDANKTNLNSVVSLKADNLDINKAVAMMLTGTNIKYQIKDRQIVLIPGNEIVNATQQAQTVRGTVIDENGDPMIGVNVTVDGTSRGTVTDLDGRFSISVGRGEALTFSYIGYKDLNVRITGQNNLSITMAPAAEVMDEVVVVGYGTQKKVNLTGAVVSVNVSELAESRPITNVSNALAGAAAGLSVISASNRPGEDTANLRIRGVGTFSSAGSDPLVIIDGVEGYLNDININDVESISVLKDAASAAIYGSRAANGVILITTKQGKSGKLKLSYNGYVTAQSAKVGHLNPVSNYADYIEYMNEGYTNSGVATPYPTSDITAWRNDNGKNPLMYPNTDWLNDVLSTGIGTNHTVSLQGGSDNIQYYGSLGFYNNPGVVENTGYKNYHVMQNATAKITDWLKMGINLSGYYGDMDPTGYRDDEGRFSFGWSVATTPAMVLRHDGKYGGIQGTNSDISSSGNNMLLGLNSTRGENITRNGKGKVFLTLNPIDGLDITGSLLYEYTNKNTKNIPVFHDIWNFATNTIMSYGGGTSYISQENYRNTRNYMDLVAHYDKRFFDKNLGVGVMLGASQEQYTTENEKFTRQDLVDLSVSVVKAANGTITRLNGEKSVWAMRSYFGRINLDWQNKYLVEFNLRNDLSSRFLRENRSGWFPSGSIGWRISEEEFMKDGFFDNLKIRASYGSLGNNAVGNYAARSVYNAKNTYIGNQVETGWAITSLANPTLTWETTKVFDVGFDFAILKNRLTGTFDYYNKKTSDILLWLTVPNVNGDLTGVTSNFAKVSNKGYEITLSWNDKVGDFRYGVSANFTHNTNKIDKFKGSAPTDWNQWDLNGNNIIREGGSLGDLYMYETDRLIQTDADLQYVQSLIASNPNYFKSLGYKTGEGPGKGDVLFKDWTGIEDVTDAAGNKIGTRLTGTPDGQITTEDRKVVGNTNPKNFFGINLYAGWKGIDFSVSMDGATGHVGYQYASYYFSNIMDKDHQITKYIVENAWREGKTDAKFPKLVSNSLTANTYSNTLWLQKRNFLKVRNIQLGYTLPKVISHKFYVEKLRVYGSLENFFTLTKWDGIDPETANLTYPTMRQAVIGLNVEF